MVLNGAWAQAEGVTRWTTQDGLPQNAITSLWQSPEGFLWVGTRGGLARFDGVRFQTAFAALDGVPFTTDAIRSLTPDAFGATFLVTTKRAIFRNESDRLQPLASAPPQDQEITAILPDRTQPHALWLGSERGLWLFDGRKTQFMGSIPGSETQVFCLAQDSPHRLWIGTYFGLWSRDHPSGELRQVWQGPPTASWEHRNPVRCLAFTTDGTLWVGTERGLWRHRDGQVTPFPSHPNWMTNAVRALVDTPTRGMLVLTDRRLFTAESHSLRELDLPLRSRTTSVTCALEDRERNLWIGTDTEGLFRIRRPTARWFGQESGLSHPAVWSVAPARQGGVWVATSGGLGLLSKDSFRPFAPIRDDDRTELRCVLEDRQGRLWTGHAMTGGTCFTPAPGGWRPHAIRLPYTQASFLYEDRFNRIWFGFKDALLCIDSDAPAPYGDPAYWEFSATGIRHVTTTGDRWILRGRQWVPDSWPGDSTIPRPDPQPPQPETCPLPLDQTLSDLHIQCALLDRNDTLWLGSHAGGLNRIQDGAITVYRTRDGLGSDELLCATEDHDGGLWFGTTGGLTRWFNGRWFNFTTHHGLPDLIVNHIIDDGERQLWIACNRGIYRVHRAALHRIIEGSASSASTVLYSEIDGLVTAEITGGFQPGACRTRDGQIWFPTLQGLAAIDPVATIALEPPPPPVRIEHIRPLALPGSDSARPTQVYQPFHPSHHDQVLDLPPGSGHAMEIHFTALALTAPERAVFRYRLIGHDPDWIHAESRRVAQYSNLRPGAYRFEVTAANHRGVWNPIGAALQFVIAPHFHETALFNWGVAALVSLAVALFARRRVLASRRLHALQRQTDLALERERIRRDLHDDLGLGIARITRLARDAVALSPLPSTSHEYLRRIAAESEETYRSLRAIVWSVNPQHDSLQSLAGWLRSYIADSLNDTGIDFVARWPETLPDLRLEPEVRQHLYLVVKEAITNALSHSGARQISASLDIAHDALSLVLTDDGCGFEPADVTDAGNGLANMRNRMHQVGGTFSLQTKPGSGTSIRLTTPLRPVPDRPTRPHAT